MWHVVTVKSAIDLSWTTMVEDKAIQLKKIDTEKNASDMLTKVVPKKKLKLCQHGVYKLPVMELQVAIPPSCARGEHCWASSYMGSNPWEFIKSTYWGALVVGFWARSVNISGYVFQRCRSKFIGRSWKRKEGRKKREEKKTKAVFWAFSRAKESLSKYEGELHGWFPLLQPFWKPLW